VKAQPDRSAPRRKESRIAPMTRARSTETRRTFLSERRRDSLDSLAQRPGKRHTDTYLPTIEAIDPTLAKKLPAQERARAAVYDEMK